MTACQRDTKRTAPSSGAIAACSFTPYPTTVVYPSAASREVTASCSGSVRGGAERGAAGPGVGPRGGEAGLGTGSAGVGDDGDPVRRPLRRRLGGGRQAGHEAGDDGDDELGHTFDGSTYDLGLRGRVNCGIEGRVGRLPQDLGA